MKRKMKFFPFTQISSSQFPCWACPDDVQDILEPFHPLSGLYSMLHNQQPRNGDPNISASVEEIQPEEFVMFDLLTSSLSYSHLEKVGIQRVHEHDPCSQHPSRFERSHCYKSELSNHVFFAEYLLEEHDNDIWSPIQDEQTSYLHYGSFFGNQP